jgi:hypothetical protein
MSSGARALARFTFRSAKGLEMADHFRFASRSGVNAALLMKLRSLPPMQYSKKPSSCFSLWQSFQQLCHVLPLPRQNQFRRNFVQWLKHKPPHQRPWMR